MRIFPVAILAATVFASASAADGRPQAEAEFEDSNGLIIGFGEPMQTWQGLPKGSIRFEPALDADCLWGSDSEIFCRFESEAIAATRYRIHVPAGLRTQGGHVLPASTLTAETARPKLHARAASWRDGMPQVEISAEQGVTAVAAQAALRAEIGGRRAPVRLRELPPRGSWDRTPRFQWTLPDSLPAETAIRLRAVPGLQSKIGPLPGTQNEILLDAVAAEPFRLRGGACAGEASAVLGKVEASELALACMPDETVRLFFSRPLSERSVKAWAARWPAGVRLGNWGAESGYRRGDAREPLRQPGAWVELRVSAPRQEVTLPAPEELRSVEGKSAQSATIRLRTLDFRPALRAAHQRTLLREGGDGTALAESVNAPPVTLLMDGIGAGAHRESFVTPSRKGNQPLPIASPATERILAEGGWASWSIPAAKPDQAPRVALQFAAPDFDLYAIGGRREVLAWANEWTGGPVRGAEVELLWLETADAPPRTVARGSTGEDGVARIALPASFVLPEKRNGAYPMWMLRAATGRRAASPRAVLPLNTPYDYGVALGSRAPRALWGVADRPLYRAGDTARYRLWLRERAGGRLLRPDRITPMELRLGERYGDKPIKRWTAMPGADGGLSGEVGLPVHLPDAEYCITEDRDYTIDGVCFYVGTFRAQDLWAEAKTQDRLLRDGDQMRFSIESGYYSGGPAAGVPIRDVAATLERLDFAQTYPQFESFSFGDARIEPSVALKHDKPLSLTTDAEGRARGETTVAFDEDSADHRPAFGRIRITGEAKPSDREGTVAVPATARYARYARYVGLKLQPEWPQASSPIVLEAVVADAEGREIADAPVAVEVDYLAADGDEAPAQRLQVCTLPPRRAQACDFPRAKTGRYRLAARSEGAGPAVLERYIWRIGDDDPETPLPRKLEVQGKPGRAGEPLRVVLSQKAEQGQALFVFSAGDRVLGYQSSPLRGRAQEFALATQPDWPQNVHLNAYVRTQAENNADLRRPAQVDAIGTGIEWKPSEPVRDLALEFSAASAQPADTVRIVLRNDGRSPRKATLAVIDDALLSLAADQWRAFDPADEWLLSRASYGAGLKTVGFLGWNDSPWRRWLAWDRPAIAQGKMLCEQTDPAETAACAAQAAADAAAANGTADLESVIVVANGAINPIDISSFESTALLSAEAIDKVPGERNVTQVALLAPGATLAQPLPAPPPPAPPVVVDEARATSLDSVTVVGSGIELPGIANQARGRDDPPPTREQTRQALALARVRTRFADTALWLPEITLAPGESRSIELTLPDNLTRWRAVAWSSDADDDFEKAEAALATGLPIEARLQSPVRIFAGDRSRLAANVRQIGDAATQAQVALRVDDGQGHRSLDHDQVLPLQARGQSSFGAEIAPQAPGALIATAYAQTPAGRDAVASRIEVAATAIEARKVQAGWLGRDPRALQLPALPAGAGEPVLQLSLVRGDAGLIRGWTDGLRDYPHRCWEQILSRAVAAALALQRGDGQWPDAQAAVDEAIDNATVFQDSNGGFRFFVQEQAEQEQDLTSEPDPVLTAYSVRALKMLNELGHAVDSKVVPRAQLFLESVVDEKERGKDDPNDDAQAAYALAAGVDGASAALDRAWRRWEDLPLGARVATAEALAAADRPEASAAIERLLQKTQARGEARTLQAGASASRWMSSSLREQCALIGLLREHPRLAPADAQRSLRAGLFDLYAGGVDTADTQAAATCLMALRGQEEAGDPNPSMTAMIGGERHTLSLALGRDRDEWRVPLPPSRTLALSASQGERPTAYLAQVIYREDARRAAADAVGFALQRQHEVLRDGRWLAVQEQRLQEGDWIRITLTVDNAAPRHFVAVTDSVPGGLRPTDLSLKGVAGLVLQRLSDPGSGAFATRKLDPASPRFYAEHLPAGRHEIHYFARVGNAGDYLAAPALAELMYGNASRARTAATRLRIEADEPSPR